MRGSGRDCLTTGEEESSAPGRQQRCTPYTQCQPQCHRGAETGGSNRAEQSNTEQHLARLNKPTSNFIYRLVQFLGVRNIVYRTVRKESISKTIQQKSFQFLRIVLEDVSSARFWRSFVLISLFCRRRMPDDAWQLWGGHCSSERGGGRARQCFVDRRQQCVVCRAGCHAARPPRSPRCCCWTRHGLNHTDRRNIDSRPAGDAPSLYNITTLHLLLHNLILQFRKHLSMIVCGQYTAMIHRPIYYKCRL